MLPVSSRLASIWLLACLYQRSCYLFFSPSYFFSLCAKSFGFLWIVFLFRAMSSFNRLNLYFIRMFLALHYLLFILDNGLPVYFVTFFVKNFFLFFDHLRFYLIDYDLCNILTAKFCYCVFFAFPILFICIFNCTLMMAKDNVPKRM